MVVLAGRSARDREYLRHIVERHEMTAVEVSTPKEALKAIGAQGASAVLCEESLPWRDLLGYLAEACDPPRVAVVAAAPSDALCAEVLDLGGFGVIDKPFFDEDVDRLLLSACSAIGGELLRFQPGREENKARALRRSAQA